MDLIRQNTKALFKLLKAKIGRYENDLNAYVRTGLKLYSV